MKFPPISLYAGPPTLTGATTSQNFAAPEVFAAGVRKGLNMEQVEEPTFEELNQPVIVNQDYKWENRMYLAPIFANETYKNPQMVQAPEY